MPRLAPRPCTMRGCRKFVDGGARTSRCEEHQPPAWQTSEGRSSQERGYGYQWQRLRRVVLAGEPLCRECQRRDRVAAAVIVDHIIPKAEGGTDEMSNLQPLCRRCSDDKTQREAQRGRAKR